MQGFCVRRLVILRSETYIVALSGMQHNTADQSSGSQLSLFFTLSRVFSLFPPLSSTRFSFLLTSPTNHPSAHRITQLSKQDKIRQQCPRHPSLGHSRPQQAPHTLSNATAPPYNSQSSCLHLYLRANRKARESTPRLSAIARIARAKVSSLVIRKRQM